MARGWESKSVESQIEERSAPRERNTERTREDAEEYATALCALLNVLKERRI